MPSRGFGGGHVQIQAQILRDKFTGEFLDNYL